jgi:uncharacterized protein YlxW (UPF0749 family)
MSRDQHPSGDPELRKIQLQIAATELRLKEAELRQKEHESKARSWLAAAMRNPMIVGAVITALATVGASYVTSHYAKLQKEADRRNEAAKLDADIRSKQAQLELERDKAQIQQDLDQMRHEASLITSAIERGGGLPDAVAQNLCFLLQTGLLPRTHTQTKLQYYLEDTAQLQRNCRPLGQ